MALASANAIPGKIPFFSANEFVEVIIIFP